MNEKNFDYIVIGAGAAGLAFSAVMEKRGANVLLLESHIHSGGCASYFERNKYIFDAGATTLSGLLPDRPINRIINECGLDFEIKKIDPGIISIIGDKKIRRYASEEKWLKELDQHFPNLPHEKFWKKIFELNKQGWTLTKHFKKIPLRNWRDLFSFLKPKIFLALKLLPTLLRSLKSELDRYDKLSQNQDYNKLLNEFLFITAQNHAQETPLLMGAMGLCYPEDTGYAIGGMKAFINELASKCHHLHYQQKVLEIVPLEKGHKGFLVKTKNTTWAGKNVVSTLPWANHETLFSDNHFFKNSHVFSDPQESWSAFMMYFTIPLDINRESLYFQIHCDSIIHCETKSFFVSLSHPQDLERSHSNRQTVTLSTHTKTNIWENLTSDEYKRKKEEISDFILNVFLEKFKLNPTNIEHLLTATPKTFKKYTQRHHGLVGGIPHSTRRNIFNVITSPSPYKNLYFLGDTQFPGQGIAAVCLGALNLADQIIKKN